MAEAATETMHTAVGKWLSKKRDGCKAEPYGRRHVQVYPGHISQKRVRFVFGQSRGSWGVFSTLF